MTFGDRATAFALLQHYNALMEGNGKPRIPGFTELGKGSYRHAFLHSESGLVYKVGNYYSNVNESSMSRYLRNKSQRDLPFEVVIPRTRTYRFTGDIGAGGYREPVCVSVQEYAADAEPTVCEIEYGGDCTCDHDPCYTSVWDYIENWSGLCDMHSDNVLVDSLDRFWLIDMAD